MRVLSYNIQKGFGGRDRKYDFQRVIDVIEHENPDFICLQEVDHNTKRTKFHDQPKILTEYFGYEAADYQFNHGAKTGGYGNFLLSRYPLKSVTQLCLKLIHRKKRGAQIAVVDSPEGEFVLVGWHLGLKEKQRHNQVRHVLDNVEFQSFSELPTLIVGDFNDWRNTLAAGPFAEHGFEQITRPPSRFRSFPAYLPIGSLDKAFCRGKIYIREVRMVKTQLSKVASDHLPIVVDFHLHEPQEIIPQ